MENSKKGFLDKIHGWIEESQSSVVKWMVFLAFSTIITLLGTLYSDHNKVSAHDNIIVKDYPKYTKRVDSLSILPFIQTEKIANIEKDIKELNETAKEGLGDLRRRQDEMYTLMLEMARNKK